MEHIATEHNATDDIALETMRRQHGVITRQQALALGLSARQVEGRLSRGEWRRVATGVYRHMAVPPTWHGAVMAACARFSAVASHRTAGRLHEIDDLSTEGVEVTIDHQRRRPITEDVVVHETTQWDRRDVTVVDGIPTTGLARTVLDIGAVVNRRRLDAVVDALLRAERLSLLDLRAALERHSRRGRTGCGPLRELLDERDGEAGLPLSVWSRDVARLLVESGLPRPLFEHRIVSPAGRFLAQVDLAYPDERVGIELDSVRWHLNRESFERDPARRNQLTVAGWTILNFTWQHFVDRPTLLCHQVASALRSANSGSIYHL